MRCAIYAIEPEESAVEPEEALMSKTKWFRRAARRAIRCNTPGGVVERPEESAVEPEEMRRTGRSTQRGAVEQEESAVKLRECSI